jgi:hypothetical protein
VCCRYIHEGLRGRPYPYRYWLDLGKKAKTGHVILGEPSKSNPKKMRLPMVNELFREILDPQGQGRRHAVVQPGQRVGAAEPLHQPNGGLLHGEWMIFKV